MSSRFNSACATVAITVLLFAGCSSGDGSRNGPPSLGPVITGVTFDESSHQRLAQGSDNWPLTWSDDDHQYAMWGDGGGFNGSESDGRSSFGVARIEGNHDNYRGVNRFGGKDGECASNIHGKAHGAPISVGGVLYVWVSPHDDQHGYGSFSLYRSLDKGCTWLERDVAFVLASDGISYGGFVLAGKDNTFARDAYVYTVAPAVTNTDSLRIVQRPGRIMLLRVPTATIEDRGAYEFYAGKDSTGEPVWSASIDNEAPIYEDPQGVGPFPLIIYVPGLDRWVYTNQHGDGTDDVAMRSLLTIAEAPQPWGPWTIVFRDVFFPAIEQSVFQWSFAPKWFREDGRKFTLVFSGDRINDSWNTVDGAFTVAPP